MRSSLRTTVQTTPSDQSRSVGVTAGAGGGLGDDEDAAWQGAECQQPQHVGTRLGRAGRRCRAASVPPTPRPALPGSTSAARRDAVRRGERGQVGRMARRLHGQGRSHRGLTQVDRRRPGPGDMKPPVGAGTESGEHDDRQQVDVALVEQRARVLMPMKRCT